MISETILLYNPGGNSQWGQLGYAVPNFGQTIASLNETIATVVNVTGRNLFAIMQSTDATLRTPPTYNTLVAIHKLVCRARAILSARAVPDGAPRMQTAHASPSPKPFVLYPTPYFTGPGCQAVNAWMVEYAGLILAGLSEAMQNSENLQPFSISTTFAGLVGQYLQTVYVRMATELLGIDAKTASDPAFTLTQAQLQAYNPSQWFTSTELIDTLPPLQNLPSAADLQVLAAGIPAGQLTGLQPPPGIAQLLQGTGTTVAAAPQSATAKPDVVQPPTTAVAASTGAFVAPPGTSA